MRRPGDTRLPNALRFLLLIAVAAGVASLALVAGSTEIGVGPALAAVFGEPQEPARTVVMELRAPRLVSAFAMASRHPCRRVARLIDLSPYLGPSPADFRAARGPSRKKFELTEPNAGTI